MLHLDKVRQMLFNIKRGVQAQELQQELEEGREDLAEQRAATEQLVRAQEELTSAQEELQQQNSNLSHEAAVLRDRNESLNVQVNAFHLCAVLVPRCFLSWRDTPCANIYLSFVSLAYKKYH